MFYCKLYLKHILCRVRGQYLEIRLLSVDGPHPGLASACFLFAVVLTPGRGAYCVVVGLTCMCLMADGVQRLSPQDIDTCRELLPPSTRGHREEGCHQRPGARPTSGAGPAAGCPVGTLAELEPRLEMWPEAQSEDRCPAFSPPHTPALSLPPGPPLG